MTLSDHYKFDEFGSIELGAEIPKLPFDANDYHALELNEDFIVPSASFVNDYTRSPATGSGESTIDDIEQISQNSHVDSCLAQFDSNTLACIDEAIDKFIGHSGLFNEADIRSGALSPLIPDGTIASILNNNIDTLDSYANDYCNDYTYAQTNTSCQDISSGLFVTNMLTPIVDSVDDGSGDVPAKPVIPVDVPVDLVTGEPKYKITDYNHRDFRCGVLTACRKLPCKNKITCTFHTNEQKMKIPRSDTLANLLDNFKHIQTMSYDLYNHGKATLRLKRGFEEHEHETYPSYRLKRHNSCDLTDSTGLQFAFNESISSMLQMKENSDDGTVDAMNIADWTANGLVTPALEFSNSLTTKLLVVPFGIEERLLEFEKRTGNIAQL